MKRQSCQINHVELLYGKVLLKFTDLLLRFERYRFSSEDEALIA